MNYVEVCKTEAIKEGEKSFFNLDGHAINVAKVGGSFYAFDDLCTHKQCSLSEGFLEGSEIECPCHGARFNVTSGAVTNLPAVLPLKTYPVKIENDSIYVQC